MARRNKQFENEPKKNSYSMQCDIHVEVIRLCSKPHLDRSIYFGPSVGLPDSYTNVPIIYNLPTLTRFTHNFHIGKPFQWSLKVDAN